jgi:hypothetical protein
MDTDHVLSTVQQCSFKTLLTKIYNINTKGTHFVASLSLAVLLYYYYTKHLSLDIVD